MLKRYLVLSALAVALATGLSKADDFESLLAPLSSSQREHTLDNFQLEVTQCSIYYSLLKESMDRLGEDVDFVRLENAIERLELSMFALGDHVNFTEDFVMNRYQSVFQSMLDEMDRNYYKITELIEMYDDNCEILLRSPEDRLRFWANHEKGK